MSMGYTSEASVCQEESGATAVEFAIIAPVFLMLVLIVAEVALVFVAEEMLERATKEAARTVRTGHVHANKVNKKKFENQFCRNLLLLKCDKKALYIDVNAYNSFLEMDTTPPLNASGNFVGSGKSDFGAASDIVVVRAYYQWPTSPIMGELTLANLENGHRLISSFAAFRNEPFPASARGAVAAAEPSAGGAP